MPVEQPVSKSTEEAIQTIAAEAVYSLLISALAVADKDETPGAAERWKQIALAADAYLPLTGSEQPSWICDANYFPTTVTDE